MKPALLERVHWVLAIDVVIALVPHHDSSSAVLPLWNDSFESRVFDGVIFHFYRQMLFTFLPGKAFRHSPGLQDPIHFQTEVVMQSSRVVFLNDKPGRAFDELRQGLPAFGLRGDGEISLFLVLG